MEIAQLCIQVAILNLLEFRIAVKNSVWLAKYLISDVKMSHACLYSPQQIEASASNSSDLLVSSAPWSPGWADPAKLHPTDAPKQIPNDIRGTHQLSQHYYTSLHQYCQYLKHQMRFVMCFLTNHMVTVELFHNRGFIEELDALV